MDKDIKVTFLSGLSKSDFEDIKDLGYEVDIPDGEKPRIMAYSLKPEDYIIIFAIHFSLKVADQLTNKMAKKLAANFYKVIKKLWTKFKDSKPRYRANPFVRDFIFCLPLARSSRSCLFSYACPRTYRRAHVRERFLVSFRSRKTLGSGFFGIFAI